MVSLSELTIQPGNDALAALRNAWRWMLGEHWTPLLFSAIGDIFLELPSGSVWWLSTATAGLEQIAESRDRFHELLATDRAAEWFLPGLVEALRAGGKPLEPDQCYTYVILPIFAEGSFSAENMRPGSAEEHYRLTGQLHENLQRLPVGAEVRIIFA